MADKNKLEVVLSIMDKATEPLQAFSKRIEKLQEPVRKVSNKLAVFGQAAGFGKLRDAAGGVQEAFGNVAEKAGDLATKIATGAIVAGGAIFALVKHVANVGDAAVKSAAKAGVSIATWQELAHAADMAGVGSEELGSALGKLNRNIIEGATGNKEYAKWFARAGLSVSDLRKLKPEEVLTRISEKMASMPDGAKKTALAMALLGKSGANLIPLLNGGAKGLEDARKEAQDLGIVLSDDAASAGEAFNDNLSRLIKTVDGLAMTIGGSLLPYADEIVVALKNWIAANRELITSKIEDWMKMLRENWPAIKQGALDAWAAFEKFGRGMKWFVDTVGGVGNALAIVAAVMAGPLVVALAAATKAIAAFGLALLTTPIGWIVLGIAAIAGAVYLIYKNWDGITKWFTDLWDELVKVFWYGIDDALRILRALDPMPIFKKAWEPLKKYLSDLWDDISKLFTEQIDKITGMLKKLDPTVYVKKAWDWATGDDDAASQDQMANSVMRDGASLGSPAGVSARAVETAQSRLFGSTQTNNASVSVDFKNVPRGTEVTPGSNNTAPLDLSMGYSMVTP